MVGCAREIFLLSRTLLNSIIHTNSLFKFIEDSNLPTNGKTFQVGFADADEFASRDDAIVGM